MAHIRSKRSLHIAHILAKQTIRWLTWNFYEIFRTWDGSIHASNLLHFFFFSLSSYFENFSKAHTIWNKSILFLTFLIRNIMTLKFFESYDGAIEKSKTVIPRHHNHTSIFIILFESIQNILGNTSTNDSTVSTVIAKWCSQSASFFFIFTLTNFTGTLLSPWLTNAKFQ